MSSSGLCKYQGCTWYTNFHAGKIKLNKTKNQEPSQTQRLGSSLTGSTEAVPLADWWGQADVSLIGPQAFVNVCRQPQQADNGRAEPPDLEYVQK